MEVYCKESEPSALHRADEPMRSIHELTTEEAYHLVAEHFGHSLPPLDAVENEDWGRDYVLQHFQQHTAEELAAAGLSWGEPDNPSCGKDSISP